jgi:type II secretory pathway component PulF
MPHDLDLYFLILVPASVVIVVLYIGFRITMALITKLRRYLFSDLLLEHFAALVRLRLPLQDFAVACRNDVSNASGRDMAEVESGLRDGRLLGDALGCVPLPRKGLRAFIQSVGNFLPGGLARLVTPAEAEVLRVGETSGNLDTALRLVLDERRKSTGLMASLYVSLLYPLAVVVIMSGILWGIATFIVPKWRRMYEELDIALPGLTQLVFDFFRNFWMFLVLIPIGLPVLFILWTARKRLREMHRSETGASGGFRRFLLAPSFFLGIGAKQRMTEFCRELAMLLRVGTPAHRALEVLAGGTMNPWFRERVRRAQQFCEKGVPLSRALEQADLDRRAAWYARAEGNPVEIADGLLEVGDEYSGKHRLALAVVKELIGPVAIFTVGVFVGCVFVSMFLPIIKLMGSIGG